MASGKGSQFERDVCRQLSLWWSEGENDDVFWRTSQSGGRATTRAKSGKKTRGQEGDIAATDPSGFVMTKLFTMELKRGYNDSDPIHCLDWADGMAQQKFDKFLCQAEAARSRSGSKYWLIIHKRDKRQPMCYFPTQLVKDFGNDFKWTYTANFRIMLKNGPVIRFTGMPLKPFLAVVSPDRLKLMYKEWGDE